MSGINGELAAEAFVAECAEEEASRCARFLARFLVKQELDDDM